MGRDTPQAFVRPMIYRQSEQKANMARRPNTGFREKLTHEQLVELRHKLAEMPIRERFSGHSETAFDESSERIRHPDYRIDLQLAAKQQLEETVLRMGTLPLYAAK
jgi:hypothetical protein